MNKLFNKVKYLSQTIKVFKNWFVFLMSHYGLDKSTDVFRLRNGLSLKVPRGGEKDWSTDLLMDIFIRKDYGVISEGNIIIDIGANIGAFALYACYNNNNICYCYEPEKLNFDILVENINSNNLQNRVRAFNYAVAENCENKKLYKFESVAHSLVRESDNYDVVKCIDMKSIFENNDINKVDILKIDCEGGEYDILYNTDEKTFRKINKFILEYHNYSDDENKRGDVLIKYLVELNFNVLSWVKMQNGVLGVVWLERVVVV